MLISFYVTSFLSWWFGTSALICQTTRAYSSWTYSNLCCETGPCNSGLMVLTYQSAIKRHLEALSCVLSLTQSFCVPVWFKCHFLGFLPQCCSQFACSKWGAQTTKVRLGELNFTNQPCISVPFSHIIHSEHMKERLDVIFWMKHQYEIKVTSLWELLRWSKLLLTLPIVKKSMLLYINDSWTQVTQCNLLPVM